MTRLYQVVKLSADTYLLKFNYVCRIFMEHKPYQCILNLYWNEELIATLKAKDFEVQTASFVVTADQENNRITF
jgi:hypothetical protein